jgi:protein tyrosine/serine phosphatase
MADFDKFFSEYRNIREMCSKDRPIVVHCSAGVGRTGSFIAIDMLIDRMQNAVIKEGRLSVEPSSYLPDIVYVIRKQRNENMVQSKDQFAFIYEFVTSYQDQFVSMKKGRISIGKCTPAISRNGSRSALSTVLSSDEEMESLPRIAEKSIVQFDEESKDA